MPLDYRMVEDLSKVQKVMLQYNKNQQDMYAQLYLKNKLLHNHFRRHVLRTSTKRICELTLVHVWFG